LLEFSDGISSLAKQGNIGFRSSFLACFGASGNYLWAKTLHNTTDGSIHIVDLSIDTESSVYLLNEYWGTIVNQQGNAVTGRSTDLLLERYDENGNLIASMGIGGSSNDFGYDIVAHGNSVFTYSTAGNQGGSFYIGTDSLGFSDGYLNNMILLKLVENPALVILENKLEHTVDIFPNPNNGVFTVSMPKENIELCISSASGKIVYKTAIQNTELFNVDMQNFLNGIYILNVKSNKFNIVKKVVKN